MNNDKKKITAAALPALVFVGLLALVSMANLLMPQKDFSEMENRKLTQFPTISAEKIRSGQWMSSFERYTSDQFPFRDGLMQIKTASDLALRRKDNGRVYFGEDGYLFAIDTINDKQENAALTLTADFIQRMKTTYPSLNISVLLAPTAQAVLPGKLPSHAPVTDQPGALKRAEAYLTDAAPGVVFTNPLDALTAADGSASFPLYYRTDHHWTADGAYIAYHSWARDNGFTPFDKSVFRREIVSGDFLGTNQAKAPGMSVIPDQIVRYTPKKADGGVTSGPSERAGGSASNAAETAEDATPDTARIDGAAAAPGAYRITVWKDITKPEQTELRDSLYVESFLHTRDQYAYFLGGNDPQVNIKTRVKNGRRLLLVKDSYANSMIPFLALHYEEICVTDLRYSHGNLILPADAAAESGSEAETRAGKTDDAPFTDVMLLYNVDSFCSDKNLAYLTQLKF